LWQCFGAGGAATFFRSQAKKISATAPEPGMLFLKKCDKNPKFFILKLEVEFKNPNFVASYLKNLLMIIFALKT
jgi:hypothetical protein